LQTKKPNDSLQRRAGIARFSCLVSSIYYTTNSMLQHGVSGVRSVVELYAKENSAEGPSG